MLVKKSQLGTKSGSRQDFSQEAILDVFNVVNQLCVSNFGTCFKWTWSFRIRNSGLLHKRHTF